MRAAVTRPNRPVFFVLAAASALVLLASVAATVGWSQYAASLGPIDLAASREGSTIVVDRDGRLLRPFTLPDGRWRLPATDARRRSALSRDAHRLRGRAVLSTSRRRRRGYPRGDNGRSRPCRLRRFDADHAGRAPHRAAGERTIAAKLRQIARAFEIERQVGKPGVLDRYLTVAPFGGNLEGVRAASLAYFGKEPLKLTVAEAALLVALPQAPEGEAAGRSRRRRGGARPRA